MTPSIHAAILLPRYIEAILRGEKTIESRLLSQQREPIGRVHAGERLYFKEKGGPFRVTALAARVEHHLNLSPRGVRELKKTYNDRILGDEAYWLAKAQARHATLVWLCDVEPISAGPLYRPRPRAAWFVLPARLDVYPACLAQPTSGSQACRTARPSRAARRPGRTEAA